jgi:hypothetical protein
MTEETTQAPVSSPEGNSQQAPGGPQSATNSAQKNQSNPLDGYVPEARLTGALQKIQELTLTNKSLQDQLQAANTRVGELQAQVQVSETDWKAKVGEGSQKLETVTGERDNLQAENARLQAELEKAKMVGELGHHELLPILDQIPSDTDPEKQKANIQRMATWADQLLKQREDQLTAGQTDTPVQPASTVGGESTAAPKTAQQWEKYIESKPFGSPERQEAWDQYWKSLNQPAQS